MIQGGLTKKLQVLNVSTNKFVKIHLLMSSEKRMADGLKEFTKSKSIEQPFHEEIFD
ncbi:hypothetical protein MXB_2415 [Myxobolus squamalis]|nr:hypothetical protein MXB_2415 [Myxobolus squamalis]